MDDDLAYATFDEIQDRYRRGELTPVEAAEFFLDRLTRLGPALNAVAAPTADRALGRARRLSGSPEPLGLWGIPFGIKDMFDLAGTAPGNGSDYATNRVPEADAAVVQKLEQEGAILAARLAMHEFGGLHTSDPGRSSTGATRNPWDTTRWSGGSSTGPGAAVAAGLVPFAIGAESGGSIAFPSNFCGLTGLRPTFGTIDLAGASLVCWTIDKVGPMAHTARDCGRVLAALTGASAAPEHSLASPDSGLPLSAWRLGIADYDIDVVAEPAVRGPLREGIAVLTDLGARIADVELPTDVPYNAAIAIVAMVEAASAVESLARSPHFEQMTHKQRGGMIASEEIRATDYLLATQVRGVLSARFARIFESVDAIVSFVTPWPAPAIGAAFKAVPITGGTTGLIMAANLCGLPAVFLPTGFTEGGLPVGMQVVGRPNADRSLLELGEAFQDVTDWHRRRPPSVPDDVEAGPPIPAPAGPIPDGPAPDHLATARRQIAEHVRVLRAFDVDDLERPGFRFVP